MCMIELEPCQVWVENDCVAKRDHKTTCDCCNGKITAGMPYITHFSKYDGDVTYGKLCGACRDDRAVFADAHDGGLPQPNYLITMIEECIGEGGDDDKQWQEMLDRIERRGQQQ